MGLFGKKQKLTVEELGLVLLRNMMKFIATKVEHFIEEPVFCALKNDKDKFFSELLMLSFWNLQYLGYPIEIVDCAVSIYFDIQKLSKTEKQNLSELMGNRFKDYFDGWEKGASTLCFQVEINTFYNILKIELNPFDTTMVVIPQIGDFLVELTDVNNNFLHYIKDKVKIIPSP